MQSTSSVKSLESEPQVVMLAEEEVPDPPTTTATPTPILTMMPSPTTTPSTPTGTPQTRTVQPSLLPVFQALAMVLAGRLMALLLVASAILFGYLTISEPTPLRLVAASGYAVFCLAALWVIPKR
jgi:hypothetical protein